MRTSHILAFANLGSVALAAVELYGQCGGSGYSGETACVSGACCTKANEWYSQCVACAGGGNGGTSPEEPKAPTTTILGGGETSIVVVPTLKSTKVQTKSSTKKAQSTAVPAPTSGSGSGSGSVPQGVTRTLPKSSGAVSSSTAIPVKGSFDGGMKLYDRSPAVCKDQTETGEKDAMFILEDGATLSNVIIGPGQAEGVHCKGTCTLINVWFEDVCEDAITLKQTSGTSFIKGGGAFHASDKVVQFNGRGTVEISNFYAEDYGKLVRSCGNCKGNGGPRNVVIEGAVAVDGGVLCGINTNYGDTCTISNTCQSKGKDCDRFEGNDTGKEPKKIGSGPDGNFCRVDSFSTSC